MNGFYGFSCPYCGSPDIRRSRRQGFGELPKMLIGSYPFRCLRCSERFTGNVWILSTKGYASCPRCLRMTILPWVKRDSHLTPWDRFRLALGAHTYRCEPCRHTFISFRKCVNPEDLEVIEPDQSEAAPWEDTHHPAANAEETD